MGLNKTQYVQTGLKTYAMDNDGVTLLWATFAHVRLTWMGGELVAELIVGRVIWVAGRLGGWPSMWPN